MYNSIIKTYPPLTTFPPHTHTFFSVKKKKGKHLLNIYTFFFFLFSYSSFLLPLSSLLFLYRNFLFLHFFRFYFNALYLILLYYLIEICNVFRVFIKKHMQHKLGGNIIQGKKQEMREKKRNFCLGHRKKKCRRDKRA